MSDMLSTGVSALLAYQTALGTTSHNIANANTAGYTRQRVDLAARLGTASSIGHVGAGVDVQSVQRITDALVSARLQTSNSAHARIAAYADYAAQIDQLMSDSGTSLATPLQSFFSAANALAISPASTAARQSLIGSAQTVVDRFATQQTQLDRMDAQIDQTLRATIGEVNDLSTTLAKLNGQIANARAAANGQPPNDLLDQRDTLLQNLASKLGVSTSVQEDGSVNVFTGSGQALVLGQQSYALGTANDAYNSGRFEITHNGQPITARLSGGSIGGLLDTRRELLDPMRAELGKLAADFAASVNAQNAAGVDANGQRGGDLLTMPSGLALAHAANTGNAGMNVAIRDAAALTGSDYVLNFDGVAWSATDARSGASVALTGSGTAGDPLLIGGTAIVVSGSAQAGDKFLVQPTADAAAQLKMATLDPAKIAAASAVNASAANGNSATVESIAVSDGRHAQLTDAVNITFTDANTYQINGSGSYAYTPGSPISVNGWTLNLSGTPAAGDSFAVRQTGPNSNDNRNAQSLAALGGKALFGSDSLNAAQSALTTRAGTAAKQANLALDAQTAVKAQAEAARESVSGVNLDEEAADLVRFQQAYQAAAQVIATANEIFQSLLAATRG